MKPSWIQVSSEGPSSGADLSVTCCWGKPQLCFPGVGTDVPQASAAAGPAQGPEAARLCEAGLPATDLPVRGRKARPRHACPRRARPATVAHWPEEALRPPGGAPPPLPPTPPASSLCSSSSLQLPLPGRGERVRFTGTVQRWQLAQWRCSGSPKTRCGGRGAVGRASHHAAHQPAPRRRWRPGARLSASSFLCARPGSARGAVGIVGATRRARAGDGACFREPRFPCKPADSYPSPPSWAAAFLVSFLQEVLRRGLGGERRECAGAPASPAIPFLLLLAKCAWAPGRWGEFPRSVASQQLMSLLWQRPTGLNFMDFDLKTSKWIVIICFGFLLSFFYLQSFLTSQLEGGIGKQSDRFPQI